MWDWICHVKSAPPHSPPKTFHKKGQKTLSTEALRNTEVKGEPEPVKSVWLLSSYNRYDSTGKHHCDGLHNFKGRCRNPRGAANKQLYSIKPVKVSTSVKGSTDVPVVRMPGASKIFSGGELISVSPARQQIDSLLEYHWFR